jgi:hypothetical protein
MAKRLSENGQTCVIARSPFDWHRTGSDDETISFPGKDCPAEFILSAVEGLAMT